MSITVLTKDPVLARMLLLEAKRQGYDGEGDRAIVLVDIDHCAPSHSIADGIPIIGFSTDPDALPPEKREELTALLPLPFSVKEFAKILHRSPTKITEDRVRRVGSSLWLNGKELSLSATELRLFDLIYENRTRPVSADELVAVLGESATRTNTLAVYLYRLRRKLCADGVPRIRTLRGKGCQWIEESR